jgi:hypothetical protein
MQIHASFTNNEGEQYIVMLSDEDNIFLSTKTNNFLKHNDIELLAIYLTRNGNLTNKTNLKVMAQICEFLGEYLASHINTLFYFICDDLNEVPMNKKKRDNGISPQKYRSKLFTKMFEKFGPRFCDDIENIPIYIDACGHEMYAHIITRSQHLQIVNIIKEDVNDAYHK